MLHYTSHFYNIMNTFCSLYSRSNPLASKAAGQAQTLFYFAQPLHRKLLYKNQKAVIRIPSGKLKQQCNKQRFVCVGLTRLAFRKAQPQDNNVH